MVVVDNSYEPMRDDGKRARACMTKSCAADKSGESVLFLHFVYNLIATSQSRRAGRALRC